MPHDWRCLVTTAPPYLSAIPSPLPERPSTVPMLDPSVSATILIEIRSMLMRLMPLVDIPAAPEGQGVLMRLYQLLLDTAKELGTSHRERETIETELRAAKAALERLEADLARSRQDLAQLRAEVAYLKDQAASTHRMIREMHGIFTAGLPLSEAG